jgi:hypothetical protein
MHPAPRCSGHPSFDCGWVGACLWRPRVGAVRRQSRLVRYPRARGLKRQAGLTAHRGLWPKNPARRPVGVPAERVVEVSRAYNESVPHPQDGGGLGPTLSKENAPGAAASLSPSPRHFASGRWKASVCLPPVVA